MGSASTITSTDLDTTRSRPLRREAAIGAVAAAAANAAVWAAGRAADVSFLVATRAVSVGPTCAAGGLRLSRPGQHRRAGILSALRPPFN